MRTDKRPSRRPRANNGKPAVARTPQRRFILFRPSLLLLLLLAASLATAAAAVSVAECDDAASGGGDGSCAAATGDEWDDDRCEDKDKDCWRWEKVGECLKNSAWMRMNCPVSCDSCPKKYKGTPEEIALLTAVAQYGESQQAEGDDIAKVLEVMRKTVAYMRDDIYSPSSDRKLAPDVLKQCINRDALCSYWAAIGECEANLGYMKVKCAPSCQSCHMIDFESRCPSLGADARSGLRSGELNAMFERIAATAPGNATDARVVGEGMTNYTVNVLSRPAPFEAGGEPIVSEARDFEQPPWIITLDGFISDEECDRLIKMGHDSVYELSKDVGKKQVDGSFDAVESKSRTSENAWCSFKNGCRTDPIATRVHERIATVTGIPANYSEDLQLLKYEVGQFYHSHHDYIDHQKERRCGPRILTFFLYLSDLEKGGATHFTKLGISVKPKKGRGLLWPSVLNSDPRKKDPRTDHEAQVVLEGVKFGANGWLHMHDYLAAQDMGCT